MPSFCRCLLQTPLAFLIDVPLLQKLALTIAVSYTDGTDHSGVLLSPC
uniref:Uncharacterized protein n=1 Tax=Rhizophora mucronata TaxID=61149 RepID=A0A2P2P2W2_RHIMU